MLCVRSNRALSLLAAGVATTLLLAAFAQPAAAQDRPGRLIVSLKVADNALKDTPAMVSVLRPDGVMLDQQEVFLVNAPNTQGAVLEPLPEGIYDVRVEGDGFVTEVKKGVHAFSGRDAHLNALIRPGQGVHIVEYAVAGLSREEVAARLAKLESASARHDQEIQALREAGGSP